MKKLNSEQNARLRDILFNCAIVSIIGIAYFIFIKIVGKGIPCFLHLLTGLHCPGCGISRMFISLFSLDFKAAFSYNAYAMTVGPIAAIFVLRHYIKYILNGPQQKSEKLETVLLIIALALAILFGILRNIPAFSFLAP